jgi:hypothetical protein
MQHRTSRWTPRMNRSAGRLRVKVRVAFDAATLGREILVPYHVAELSRVIPAPKVIKPGRIVDAVPELERTVKILDAQVQLVPGTPKVKAAVLRNFPLGIKRR